MEARKRYGRAFARSYRFAQSTTVSGTSDWPGRGSQAAPLSVMVLGGWLTEPVFDRQVALTMTSSTLHIAGRDTPPSDEERTTRNWGGGDTPFSPFFPGEPGGPWGPVAPAGPLGPGSPFSPLSPLSPLGPEQPARPRPGQGCRREGRSFASESRLWVDQGDQRSRAAQRSRKLRSVSALTDHEVSSHLRQAGSAILAVEQVDKRQHDRTSSFDHGAMLRWRLFPAAFAGRRKRFRPAVKMVSSGPLHGLARSTAVGKLDRPVNSCAASICEYERIPLRGLVDMLRITAGDGSRWC